HKALRQVACVNNVIAKGFGCASGDNTCLCKQQDFVFGVRDCAAQSCTADESTKANDYVSRLCATATRAPPASTPPPSAPATQPTPPASTAAPTQASAAGTLIPSGSPSSVPLAATNKPITEVAQATQLPTITPTTLAAVLDNCDVNNVNFHWSSAVSICFCPGCWSEQSDQRSRGPLYTGQDRYWSGCRRRHPCNRPCLVASHQATEKPSALHTDIWPNAGFRKRLHGRHHGHKGKESFRTGCEVKKVRRHGATPVTETIDMRISHRIMPLGSKAYLLGTRSVVLFFQTHLARRHSARHSREKIRTWSRLWGMCAARAPG
ncbi:hypothetical protein LY76DRAFT_669970, partial [Colletotrichum caudatum]